LAAQRQGRGEGGRGKEGSSFLKKRSKKLSFIADGMAFGLANSILSLTNKSFLVLFFKKELLAFPFFAMG
jgi:hypothetical protein